MHTAVDACPTRHVQRILQILDNIYAAACGEATWDQTLAEVCQFGRLDAGALTTVDTLERQSVVLASWGLGCRTKPGSSHGAMTADSPLVDSIIRSTPGTVLPDRQIISDVLLTSRSGWTGSMPVDGCVSWACVIVGRDERQVACVEVYGAAGRASDPEPDIFLRQLAPHLVRAWRIGGSRSMLATPTCAASPSHADAAPAAELAGLPEAARLRAEFQLTKAEARLALRLAEGSSLASAAQAFNVKLTTVRSQLQQVFAKTGTSRQTELVAMLLGRGYGSRQLPRRPHRSMQTEAALAAW